MPCCPAGRALTARLTRFVRDGEATRGATAQFRAAFSEVGPGTGAVTAQIFATCGRTIASTSSNETKSSWLTSATACDPRSVPADRRSHRAGSAGVEELPEERPYDLIISGLPLNNFSVALRRAAPHQDAAVARPRGHAELLRIRRRPQGQSRSSAVPTSASGFRGIGQHLRRLAAMSEIRRDLVLANVPPAWVHHVRFESKPWSTARQPNR